MSLPFPSPTQPVSARAEVFVGYLDFFRERVAAKVGALSEADARRSWVGSGWTPLELVKHLRFVEFRWIEWGFEGKSVDEPWGDHRDGRWFVADDETRDELIAALHRQGAHTRSVALSRDLVEIGATGPRWDGDEPASLERVLFHLVQEYARHLGQLDIVTELAGGPVGE